MCSLEKYIVILFFILLSCNSPLTGEKLLALSISHHDPNNNWSTFNDSLFITMEIPGDANRDSEIIINIPEEYFYVKAIRDTLTTEYLLNKNDCQIKLNGKSNLSDAIKKTNRLSCETATLYKDYYTYLYGLPMKLKDPGTIIHENVEHKTFKGKDYLVLKATYDETVGSDIWYFYFDPETYAMEVYQFFHDESKNDGEYILLTEKETISNIKIPKNRAWYTNKEDKLLGTDILKTP